MYKIFKLDSITGAWVIQTILANSYDVLDWLSYNLSISIELPLRGHRDINFQHNSALYRIENLK